MQEFEIGEAENPFISLFNSMFMRGRKLRPIVQKRQPVSLDAAKEAKIMVHVIKGFNVPIRNSAKQDILSKFQGGRGAAGAAGGMMQNPYGRSAGPFAVSSQFGGT